MNITKHLMLWGGLAATMLLTASCQDEDFGFTADQIAYRSNFEKSFGNIDPDQIWDFSTYNLTRLGLEGGPSSDATRASYTGGFKVELIPEDASKMSATLDKHFELGPPMMNWLDQNLTEKVNHRDKGKNFLLSSPESGKDFLFIPIYQGHAGMEWELHLVAAPHGQSTPYYDYTIWSKSDGVEYLIDYNKAPEFYFTHENTTTQFLEWRDGMRGGQLSFADAVTLNKSDNTIGDGPVIIKFGLPAGKEVHGQFKVGDLLLTVMVDGEITQNFDFDNTSGSEFKTYEVVVGYCQDGVIKDFYVPAEDNTDAIPDPTDEKADNSPMLAPRRRAAAAFNAEGNEIDLKRLVWNFWNVSLEHDGYPGLNSYEDATRIRIYTQFDYVTDWIEADLSYQTGHTMDRAGVRAHPVQIKTSEISRSFLLYLKITKGVDGYATTGTCQRSDEGMMLALTECNVLSEPANQVRLNQFVDELGISGLDRGGKDAQYMVLGVEDANQGGSDWDLNDVVFLLVGLPDAPDIKEQIVKKRYLIEDLGSTYDFDFNDIVVDVTQERLLHPNGQASPKSTYVQLRHLCGTIPFRVKIGDEILGVTDDNPRGIFAGQNGECGEGGSGVDPALIPAYNSFTKPFYLKNADSWDPVKNNITVTSWPSYAGMGTLTAEQIAKGWTNGVDDGSVLLHPIPETAGETYGFPETGKFPYIIACDQNVMWMPEQYTVPRAWFKTWPKTYDDYLNNGGHSGDDPIVPDPDDPEDTDNDKYITWDTEYNFGTMYWDFNAKLTPKRFKNVNVGDIITIYYENANDATIQLDVIEPWTLIIQSGLASGAGTYTLTVTADLLDQFKAGGLSIKGLNYTFKKVTCTAPQYWEFSAGVAAGCEGMGTVTYTPKKDNYLDGETVHVVAAPAEGYKFVGWSDSEVIKSLERDVVITASTVNIYATFAPAAKYSVKISAAEGGQISINGGAATTLYQVADVYEGTKIVVKAVPASGKEFDRWSDDDPQGATRTLYVYDNIEFAAEFKASTKTIVDVEYTPGGTISLSNAFAAYDDASKNITVTFTLPAGTGFNGRLVVGNHVSSVSIPDQKNNGNSPTETTFVIGGSENDVKFKTALANQTTKEVTFYVDWDQNNNLKTKGDVGIKLTW